MLKRLEFVINAHTSVEQLKRLTQQTNVLEAMATKAGTGSKKYMRALRELEQAAQYKKPLYPLIDSKIRLRALPAVIRDYPEVLTAEVLKQVERIAPKPSLALLEALTQFFFVRFSEAFKIAGFATWLQEARKVRGIAQEYDTRLFSEQGAKWLAESAIDSQVPLESRLTALGLGFIQAGDFKQAAQNIYYLEQLKTIPADQNHELLDELAKPSVAQSPYSDGRLLGHEVLSIVISRSSASTPHQAWQDVVMKIAGDPRVSVANEKYQRWWQHIDSELVKKVRGWLSKYDLRLFLEALNDFKETTGNDELMRMYPARKQFMEGLLNKGLVQHTRLFLSDKAAKFLKSNYDSSTLPRFEIVDDDQNKSRSVIHIQLDGAHIVEGSHSFYLWVYKSLTNDAVVSNYSRRRFSTSELAKGMAYTQESAGMPMPANIQHNPQSWQRRAVEELHERGVDIELKDVLSGAEYHDQRRRYGVI